MSDIVLHLRQKIKNLSPVLRRTFTKRAHRPTFTRGIRNSKQERQAPPRLNVNFKAAIASLKLIPVLCVGEKTLNIIKNRLFGGRSSGIIHFLFLS